MMRTTSPPSSYSKPQGKSSSHQDWIDFTSIPMGMDTILSLKLGNKLGFLPIALAFDEIDF
jgi:hypothetical protein